MAPAVRNIILFGSPDVDAGLWRNAVLAAGGAVSTGRLALVSTLIRALKAAGIWDRLDDLWLFAAENVIQALVSLKQRRAATAVNAPTFTVDRGYAFDGATQYIDTSWVQATHAVAMTATSIRLGVYERSNVTSAGVAMGASTTSTRGNTLNPRSAANIIGRLNTSNTTIASGLTDSQGLVDLQREANDDLTTWQRGALLATATPTTAASLITIHSMFIGAFNNGGTPTSYRPATIGYADLGARLTAAQMAARYAAIQAYMTTIGAQV